MIDTPQWSAAVWVNIATSTTVAICFLTFLSFGWIRRNRLNVVQDGERMAITCVLVGIVAFFIGRGIQIAMAGATVARPWFLAIGVFLAISCVVCTVIVCRNHDEYGVLKQSEPQWKIGDKERRKGERRKSMAPNE